MSFPVRCLQMCHKSREVEACDECSRNCFLIHQRNSPRVPPFFKVMFGKTFSKIMPVPPRFSGTIASLVGKKAYLEDSTGKKWEVVLSDVQGSLAFQKGWDKFSLVHGLEQGDFVLFRYIKESHFIVEIYGRSGYEKTLLGAKSHPNKRCKTIRNSVARKSSSDSFYEEREPPQENDCLNACAVPRSDTDIIWSRDNVNNVNNSLVVAGDVQSQGNINERPQLVPEVDLIMEPFFVTDRGTNFPREEDRELLFDLSAFELPDTKTGFASKDEEDSHFNLSSSKMTNKKVDAREDHREHLSDLSAFGSLDMKPCFSSKGSRDYLSEPSASKLTNKKVDANHIGKPQLQGNPCSLVSGSFHNATGDASIDIKKRPLVQENIVVPLKKCEANMSRSECSTVPSVSPSLDMPFTLTPPLTTISEKMRVVKQEPTEFEQEFLGNLASFGANMSLDREVKGTFGDLGVKPMGDDVEVLVKSEPVDFCDHASVTRITCSVPPDNESFLELPQALPFNWRRRMILRHRPIVLRNPAGVGWPAVYHNKNGLNVLASGWKAFRKANNICPGDECVFVADNYDKGGEVQVHVLKN